MLIVQVEDLSSCDKLDSIKTDKHKIEICSEVSSLIVQHYFIQNCTFQNSFFLLLPVPSDGKFAADFNF